MAQPKKRQSSSRRDKRRANWKLTAPQLVACPRCHEPKLPHRVCANCGYYAGRLVVAEKAKNTKA